MPPLAVRAAVFAALVIACGAPSRASAQRGAPPARPVAYKEVWRVEPGAAPFRTPRAIAVTPHCHVWVADADAGALMWPCDGGSPQVAGVRGVAEGAYQQAWSVAPVGEDSIALFDRALQRVITFSGTGIAGGTRKVAAPEPLIGVVTGLAVTRGAVRFWTSQHPSVIDPAALPSLVLAVRDTARLDTLFTLPGLPSVYWGSSFSGSHVPVPHQTRPFVAFLRSGRIVSALNTQATASLRSAAGRELASIPLGIGAAQPVSRGDRSAYADSVRHVTNAEMQALRYHPPERKTYTEQIDVYLKEDVAYPAVRQRFDLLVADVSGDTLWVLESGTGRNYTRTWSVIAVDSARVVRQVTVPHRGAVVAAAVRAGSLYVVERPLGGAARVVRYSDPEQGSLPGRRGIGRLSH